MKTTIIIPTRNRAENLDCVLTSIFRQKPEREFEVLVVDDRSEDNTEEVAGKYPAVYLKVEGEHKTWNASIPRNIGARGATGDLLWFLDSDVALPDGAIDKSINAFMAGRKERVLIGSYHWLNPQIVTPSDITDRWDAFVSNQLPQKKITNRGMAGMDDIRKLSFDKAESSKDEFYSFTDSLACFGGYLLLTKNIFWAAGGYDESMLAGVEDGDFGITLYEMGVRFSYLKETCGYHIAHEQPAGRDEKTIAEQVRRLNEKHNVDMITESGRAYRQWGIDWEPPEEFYGGDKEKLEEYKKLWKENRMEFMLKVNKK